MPIENAETLNQRLDKAAKAFDGITELTSSLANGLPPEKKGMVACLVIGSVALAVIGLKDPIPAVVAEVALVLSIALLVGWKRK